MSVWTNGLNPEQTEAALHHDGPLLILAGAGSGKTTVLVSRTGEIISSGKAKPSEIAVMTFTNKAARELKERVEKKLGKSAKNIWTGTFHSFGLRVLKEYHKEFHLPKSFGVIDTSDGVGILREKLASIKTNKSDYKIETIYQKISDWKEKGFTKARDDSDYDIITEMLLPKYQEELKKLGVVDFQDLVLLPLKLLRENPEAREKITSRFKYIMVDEFQDTNDTQLSLVRELSCSHNNLAVVGDDDQSIYGWRGAQVKNILQFPKMFENCHVVRLEKNYRSSSSILNLANAIISKNENRHKKVLKPVGTFSQDIKPELFVFENEDIEVEQVVNQIKSLNSQGLKFSDIAVLYRANSQGAQIEAELRKNKIDYAISGGTGFFDRKEIKDLIAYLRASVNPNELCLRRIINTPSRGIGDESVEKLIKYKEESNITFHKSIHMWEQAGVNLKTGENIKEFLNLLDELPDFLSNLANGESYALRFLKFSREKIKYFDFLKHLYKKDDSFVKRWSMIEIFARVLENYLKNSTHIAKGIESFIESMELKDLAVDESENSDKLNLLTLHACKGLEFPAVILMGLEEDLLPHRMLGQDISEERRLFYVGVTRAKEKLIMTRVKERLVFGKMRPVAPSRFLVELPKNLYTEFSTGFKPVNEAEKTNLLSDLMTKLNQNIQKQRIEDIK